jgi:hypothetical protein
MANDGESWGKNETGGHAKEDSLAEQELIEFGTQASEHHSEDEEK